MPRRAGDLAIHASLADQRRHLALPWCQLSWAASHRTEAEEAPDGRDHAVRVPEVRQMRTAGKHHETRTGDARGERLGLLAGCCAVVGAMHDERGHPDVCEQVADVEFIAHRQKRSRRCGARGCTLITGELLASCGIRVGSEDVRQHV